MEFSFSRSTVLAGAFVCVVSLASCERMLRNMATQTTEQGAAADSVAAQSQEPAQSQTKVREPEWELTIPEGSPYENLTPPPGVEPNPFEEVDRISASYTESSNWADKNADINSLLLQNEREDYYFILQQQAANEMLRRELFPHYYQDADNKAVLDAIGTYTEHLVQAKSDDAELIYKCLRALRNHWDAHKIAQVANATAARAQARPIVSAADTTTRNGSYRQIYARELKKMAQRALEKS